MGDGKLPSLDISVPTFGLSMKEPSLGGEITAVGVRIEDKPDLDVGVVGKLPSIDGSVPTKDLSMKEPTLDGEMPTINASIDKKFPGLHKDVSTPEVNVPQPSIETEEKSSKFSLGFGKKGKKKKEKPSKTA